MPRPGKISPANPQISDRCASLFWHGENAPHVISDLHGWESNPQPMEQVAPDVWRFDFSLDNDSYMEYCFYDPSQQQRFRDPLNPQRTYNGMGAYNHYFYMPEAQPTPLVYAPQGGLQGRVTRHSVPAEDLTTSKIRRVFLYQPPVGEAVPLLVVYDGMDYFRRAQMTEVVENLILQNRIEPIALAFVENGGKARMVEYACAETTLLFLEHVLLPFAASELSLVRYQERPGVHGILGASMGGLMSVYTALRMPHIFGRAFSQAGAFVLDANETVTLDLVRHLPRPDIKLWLDCGRNDFLRESNRQMSALLAEKGYNFVYRENGGAHNYNTWRDHLAPGLEWLFGVR